MRDHSTCPIANDKRGYYFVPEIPIQYDQGGNVSPAAAFVVFSTVSLAAAISIYKTSNPDDNKDED
jgi:hypothetical protein